MVEPFYDLAQAGNSAKGRGGLEWSRGFLTIAATQFCNRIVVTQREKVAKAAETASIFAAPQYDYARQSLAAVNGLRRFGN